MCDSFSKMFDSVFRAELLATTQLFPLFDSMGCPVAEIWYHETCLIPLSVHSS